MERNSKNEFSGLNLTVSSSEKSSSTNIFDEKRSMCAIVVNDTKREIIYQNVFKDSAKFGKQVWGELVFDVKNKNRIVCFLCYNLQKRNKGKGNCCKTESKSFSRRTWIYFYNIHSPQEGAIYVNSVHTSLPPTILWFMT